MKKIFTLLLIACTWAAAANAQTDTTTVEYRYYPGSNVYYNPQTKTYSWFDQNQAKWTTGIALPISFKMKKKAAYNVIRYSGDDIWTANPDHIKMYGTQKTQAMPKSTAPPL